MRHSFARLAARDPHTRIVRIPDGEIDEGLHRALTEFESGFPIPFSDTRRYRRVQGRDYTRSFRAAGAGTAFAAIRGGRVVATTGVSIMRLRTPRGPRRAAYYSNVKVAPDARFGVTMPRLQRAVALWTLGRCSMAFQIELAGLPVNLRKMTGRFGVPRFRPLTELAFVELPARDWMGTEEARRFVSDERHVRRLRRRLLRARVAAIGGSPQMRSRSAPIWLAHPDGAACCCVEDYARGKRVYDFDTGEEILWRHVSYIGVAPGDGAAHELGETIAAALTLAAADGAESARLVIDPATAAAIVDSMRAHESAILTKAVAWGFAPLLARRAPWSLNASET